MEAHAKCTNGDVIEALQENFYGALDNKKVDKIDPVRYLIIREENEKLSKVQDKYRIAVKENKLATEIIGLWNEPYEFDDLAFKNAVYGEIKIKIKEVKRVRGLVLLHHLAGFSSGPGFFSLETVFQHYKISSIKYS